ncbi:MAG: hypothetical protein AB7G75_31940 [Candidatus Binatia bacterium]
MRWELIGIVGALVLMGGCSASTSRPVATGGTSLTPPSHYSRYYSTQKARLLGEVYSENLNQLVEKLTHSSFGQLQFANAIISMSTGFFTHAASQPPDERYLEVILGMPDILDDTTDFNALVRRLFSQYGHEILFILSSDTAIANDPKVAGYGIHFSWRSLLTTPSGPYLTMREAVIYTTKTKTQQFVYEELDLDEFLTSAILYSRQGEQPAQQVYYLPPPPEERLPVIVYSGSEEPAPTLNLFDQNRQGSGNATALTPQPSQRRLIFRRSRPTPSLPVPASSLTEPLGVEPTTTEHAPSLDSTNATE